MPQSRASFTLVELLIVMAVLAVISAIVVLVINPVELLKEARDSERLQDMRTLDSSLSLYELDQNEENMGSSTVVYVSIPDTSSTCANLGLPSLPSGWSYGCVAEDNLQQVDGTGWIPVDLTAISSGVPIGVLPVDPTNATSTGSYYTYVTGGSFELTAAMEAEDNQSQGDNDKTSTDGGTSFGAYEKGSDLSLTPSGIEEFGRDESLVGYWTFDEGSGTTAGDASGNGNNGTLTNGPTWESSGNCQKGNCLSFDGNDYVGLGENIYSAADLSSGSLLAWINTSGASTQRILGFEGWVVINVEDTGEFECCSDGACSTAQSTATVNNGSFQYIACAWSGADFTRNYINGSLDGEASPNNGPQLDNHSRSQNIGASHSGTTNFIGKIDDVRIYNRALSADEIQALYDATK